METEKYSVNIYSARKYDRAVSKGFIAGQRALQDSYVL